MSNRTPQRRSLERFGSYNDFESDPMSDSEGILDIRNGVLDPYKQIVQSTLRTSYTVVSSITTGDVFKARILGLAVGKPARHFHPKIYENTTTFDENGAPFVQDYIIFVLRNESDQFAPEPRRFASSISSYVNSIGLQGSAISEKPVSETLEAYGVGDIVYVRKKPNTWRGARVIGVAERNNYSEDVITGSGASFYFGASGSLPFGGAPFPGGATRGTTLGAGVSVAGGFLGFESKELATVYGSPGAPLTSNCTARNVTMRPDALSALEVVVQKIIQAGGTFHTSGGARGLGANVSSSRSSTSLHYLGRGIDLCTSAGMNRPQTDPYVITRDPNSSNTWIVYARSVNPDRLGISENLTLQAVKSDNTEETVTGKFINLTELFSQSNFDRIPARSGWPGDYFSSEWWHFQWEAGLVARETTFGSQLQQVWTLDQLQGTGPWVNSRNKTWNGSGAFT